MSRVYVFGPSDATNDYSTMGLVGTLFPSECSYELVGNGDSIVTLSHPVDELGKYRALLQLGNILVVPVPVRTTPEVQNGSFVTTVWKYKVKPLNQLTSKNQRTLYKNKTGSPSMKVMNAGDVLTIVWQTEEDDVRWKAKTKYGTGWVDPNGIVLVTEHVIPDNSQAIEEIQSPWTITPQYFRIYEKNFSLGEVQVSARQLYYDLLRNTTRYKSDGSVSLQVAADGILTTCYNPHSFKLYTNVANTVPGLDYNLRNPIDSILNPENGLCKKFDVNLVIDNYELYLLHDPGINRGIKVKYRRNMLGMKFNSTDDTIATRIIPIGETKDGKELMLDSDVTKHYVDSPNINAYPVIYSYPLKCDGCKVGDKDENGGTITEAIARARMRQQALDLLENKCDEPKIELEVEFLKLGDTEEYKQFKDLENVFLFDYVVVQHPDFDVDVTSQVVGLKWNVLLDRLESVKLGSVGKTLANTGITTWQVPSGFSGTKIAGGTVGSGALGDDIISTRHLQAESVNADAIQTRSLTANKIAAGEITANEIAAETITADEIAAEAITGDHIKGETIEGRHIAAETIGGDKLVADSIEADRIRTGTITAISGVILDIDADVITTGTLSVKRLLLVGENSVIHEINATSSGLTATQLTESQYQNYLDGSVIVAKSITAAQVDTKELFADTAFVEAIEALGFKISITASETVEFLIGTKETPRAYFVFGDDGFAISIPGSSYGTLADNIGYHVTQSGEIIASFARRQLNVESVQMSDGGVVQHRASDGGMVWVRGD